MDYEELMNRKVDTIEHAGVKGMKWGKRTKKTKLDVRTTGTTSAKTMMKRMKEDNKGAFAPDRSRKATNAKADAEITKATGKNIKDIKRRSVKKARKYISSYHDVEVSVKGSGKWKQTKNPYDKGVAATARKKAAKAKTKQAKNKTALAKALGVDEKNVKPTKDGYKFKVGKDEWKIN